MRTEAIKFQRCCVCIPLRYGLITWGYLRLITSSTFVCISLVCYFKEDKTGFFTMEQPHFVAVSLGLDLKMQTVNIILSIVLIVSVFWMFFSALLIKGIMKHEPSLLLSFFSFGIILTILGHLAALLMLLNKCWLLTLLFFIPFLINIHFLVVVYTCYELMQKGNDFSFRRHYDVEEDPLSDCFDETIVD